MEGSAAALKAIYDVPDRERDFPVTSMYLYILYTCVYIRPVGVGRDRSALCAPPSAAPGTVRGYSGSTLRGALAGTLNKGVLCGHSVSTLSGTPGDSRRAGEWVGGAARALRASEWSRERGVTSTDSAGAAVRTVGWNGRLRPKRKRERLTGGRYIGGIGLKAKWNEKGLRDRRRRCGDEPRIRDTSARTQIR